MIDALKTLMELREKATSGEWMIGYFGHHDATGRKIIDGYTLETKYPEGDGVVRDMVSSSIKRAGDVNFLWSAHNSLPAIAEYVKRLEKLLFAAKGYVILYPMFSDVTEANAKTANELTDAIEQALKGFDARSALNKSE